MIINGLILDPGELYQQYSYTIPADTFSDEDGNTRNLMLMVTDLDGNELDDPHWARFNATTQTLEGIPLEFSHLGISSFVLAATDSAGGVTRLAFSVLIRFATQPDTNTIVQTFDVDFEQFNLDTGQKVDLVQRVADAAGLSTTAMTIVSFESGSVRFSWSINTVKDASDCELIRNVLNRMYFLGNMTVRPMFRVTMGPFPPVESFKLVSNLCDIIPTEAPSAVLNYVLGLRQEESENQSDDDVYMNHVVPAVVVAGVLLLLAVLAFTLYRCRRKSRENLEAGTFVDRRPVVFDNDYIDDAIDMGRPIRPAAVFEYERSVSPPSFVGSSRATRDASTSGNEGGDEISERSDEGRGPHSPPYQPPPPPFRSEPSTEQQPTRPRVPVYRKPPPYQPPT